MKILFLSLARLDDVGERGIYSDLMREFMARGHEVFIVCPTERRFRQPTHLKDSNFCHILKIKTLNIQKTNIVEKGIGTLLIERQFDKAIREYWGNVPFDLVLYATPPITFNRVIERIKKRCHCAAYLMLKDIFPQNAVDLGMMRKGGLLYRMFRKKERRLYAISDYIGCMSPANCDFVLKNNPSVEAKKVEICPNSIALKEEPEPRPSRDKGILDKYDIPRDKPLFIYGGNLGKPQGIDYLIKVLDAVKDNAEFSVCVVGGGTESGKLQAWYKTTASEHVRVLDALPKADFDQLAAAADVGMIFLDPRFTIPNFPSRLLSYLESRMPVLLATDASTDMGRIAEANHFGLWCETNDTAGIVKSMNRLASDAILRQQMGENGYRFLLDNYTVDKTADIILAHF